MPNPVSARNLVETGVGPLRKFYGDIAYVSDPPEERQGQSGAYSVVVFRMAAVEVLQSTEPYPYPVAEIAISLSNRKKSRWGFFSESLVKYLKSEEDVKDIMSRRVGWVYTDGQDGRPAPKKVWNRTANAEVDAPAWEVFDIVGAKGNTSNDAAVEHTIGLLDGKSVSEFNKVALADPVVKGNVDLQRAIMDKSFVTALVQRGTFAKDENDIYHRVVKKA